MTPFKITTAGDNGSSIVRVEGEIDISNAERVLDAVIAAIEPKPVHLMLDWSGVTFLDSSGVRTLISVHRRCGEQNIGFSLTTSAMVDRVLTLVGLEDLGRRSADGSPDRV